MSIREAASVILLRAIPSGFDVFLLRRHKKASFMASAFVFPGGATEPGEDALTAAARELFEEAGVLLARDTGAQNQTLEPLTQEQLRRKVLTGVPAQALLEVAGLAWATDGLVPWAHWITPSNASPALPGGAAPPNGGAVSIASPALPGGAAPPNGGAVSIASPALPGGAAPPNGGAVSIASPALPGGAAPPNGGAVSIASPALPGGAAPPNGGAVSIAPKRFSARFFVGELPAGQVPTFDATETVDQAWVTPQEGLARAEELALPPPQIRTMWELAQYSTIADVFAAAKQRAVQPHPIMPRLAPGKHPTLLLPWDIDYNDKGIGEATPLAYQPSWALGPSRFVLEGKTWKHV